MKDCLDIEKLSFMIFIIIVLLFSVVYILVYRYNYFRTVTNVSSANQNSASLNNESSDTEKSILQTLESKQ